MLRKFEPRWLITRPACPVVWAVPEAFERSEQDPVERAWQRVLTPAAAANRSYAYIRVEDAGPGVAKRFLPRLGERFFRGSGAAVPGSGLGLAFVRTVAQRHGGELRARPGPDGRGLQVEMVLPLPAGGA